MLMIVTKEELLDYCSACAERALNVDCSKNCPFGAECSGAYIDFWRDNTAIKEKENDSI